MRVKYMYYLVKNNYAAIQKVETRKKEVPGQGSFYDLLEWNGILKSLKNISQLRAFKGEVHNILSLHLGMEEEGKDILTLSANTYNKFQSLHSTILNRMKGVIDVCEEAGFDEHELGFDVKMPPTENFNEFTEYIKDLNFVLSQCPYLRIESERIELKETDSGSIWFAFAVIGGSTIALMNLAKLVDKCIKNKSHYVTMKQQEQDLRAMKLKNDELENSLKVIDKLRENQYDKLLQELKEEIGDTENGEEDEKAIQSLKKLDFLMSKGMEIVASIDSPKEVKDVFPTSDNLILPEINKALPVSDEKE